MAKIFFLTGKIKRFIYELAIRKIMSGDEKSVLDLDSRAESAYENYSHVDSSVVGVPQQDERYCYLKLVADGNHCAGGLHMRPIQKIFEVTEKYKGNVYAKELKRNRIGNAKSMIELLTLGVSPGTPVVFCFEYACKDSEKQAKKLGDKLVKLFENGFEECYKRPPKINLML